MKLGPGLVRGADGVVVNISTSHAGGPCSIPTHGRHGILIFLQLLYIRILYILLFLDYIGT